MNKKGNLSKHLVDKRPWGNFERFTLNEKTTVKIITVKPKQRFSLQTHSKRKEFWKFLDNEAKVTVGNKTFKVKRGESVLVKPRETHRVEALSKPVSFLEISFGNFSESDIKRISDDYGRK